MLGICLRCYDVSHITNLIVGATIKCSRFICKGIIIPVDENMIHIIRILNQKGYRTRGCCSDHLNKQLYPSNVGTVSINKASYIIQVIFNDKYEFPFLPRGFKMKEGVHLSSGIKLPVSPLSLLQKKYFNKINTLLKWAEDLPLHPVIAKHEETNKEKGYKDIRYVPDLLTVF